MPSISTGRIYISHDVVFDENVFPFATLHSNAGARLSSEVLLLPSPSGGSPDRNHVLDAPPNANNAEENLRENDAQLEQNGGEGAHRWAAA